MEESAGMGPAMLPMKMIGQQPASKESVGSTSESAELLVSKSSTDQTTVQSVELALPIPRTASLDEDEDKDDHPWFDFTPRQCLVAMLILWLLASVLSIASRAPTKINRPDRSNIHSVFGFVHLPKVEKSKIPSSASELYGKVYRRSMNLSVNPCDDFNRYVCDGVYHSSETSAGDGASNYVGTNRLELALRSIFLERLREIRRLVYEETKTEELRDSEYEVFKYFESCVNSDSAEQHDSSRALIRFILKGKAYFQDDISAKFAPAARSSESSSWQDKRYGYSSLIDVRPNMNKHESDLVVNIAGIGSMGGLKQSMPERASFEAETETIGSKSKGGFLQAEEFVEGIATPAILRAPNSWKYLESLGVRRFDDATKRRIIKNYKIISAIRKIPSQKLAALYSVQLHQTGLAKKLRTTFDDIIYLKNDLTVKVSKFILAEILDKIDERFVLALDDHKFVVLMDQYHFYLGGRGRPAPCSGESCLPPSEESCALLVRDVLPLSYYSILQRLLTTDYTAIRMRSMITSLKVTYAKIIKRQTWLESREKLNLMKKVAAMIDFIGSPPELAEFGPTEMSTVLTPNYIENALRLDGAERMSAFSDLYRPPVRDPRYWINIRQFYRYFQVKSVPNAFHFIDMNLLVASSMMFAFPAYDETVDEGLILASYGSVLAHEIGHGLGKRGLMVGPVGVRVETLTKESLETIGERTSCFIPEFKIQSPFDAEKYFHASSFIEEITADHNSFQVVFETWLELTSGKMPQLPGGPSLQPEQQFFVALAYQYCMGMDSGTLRASFALANLTHPLNYIRMNRGLAHTAAFHKAFKCTTGNKMYREKKCRIFD